MRALIDTHVFLWWVLDVPRLSPESRRILLDGSNEILFSAASGYELALKARSGRLSLPEPPEAYVPSRILANGFTPISIEHRHALRAGMLPRSTATHSTGCSIAQAQIEGIPILTADPAISQYDVETIW